MATLLHSQPLTTESLGADEPRERAPLKTSDVNARRSDRNRFFSISIEESSSFSIDEWLSFVFKLRSDGTMPAIGTFIEPWCKCTGNPFYNVINRGVSENLMCDSVIIDTAREAYHWALSSESSEDSEDSEGNDSCAGAALLFADVNGDGLDDSIRAGCGSDGDGWFVGASFTEILLKNEDFCI